jgi:hypothetical protein
MFDTVFGLPLHPLVVHATVVVVPTAAVAVLLAAVWPRFRAWAGWGPLALAAAAVVLTPLSTQSGESLERRVQGSALLEAHTQLGEQLIPWVVGLLVASALTTWSWWTARRSGTATLSRSTVPGWLPKVAAVLAVVAALGTSVQVVRIGHSGAEAAWSKVAATTPAGGGDGD